MRLIRFDASRLPFNPLEKQVIYFDASPISIKLGHRVVHLIDQYYDDICNMFEEEGLEFCFLPRISETLQFNELYAYFHPDSPTLGNNFYWKTVRADNLAQYFANEEDIQDLPIGLIKYTGQCFGNDYVFSYVPIHGNTVPKLFESVRYYLQFFSERQSFDRFGLFTRTEEVEADENEKMLTMAQSLVTRLRENGVNDLVIEEIFHPTQQLSRLHVRFSRILLPDYQNMEIKMSPLPKAVFLLYLKHPEGIRFCDLPDYREELYHIYASFSGRDDANDIRASIDDVTNPLSNSINEKCSRIRHAFLSKFEEKLARNYYITGDRGTAKKIILPRELVTWEE